MDTTRTKTRRDLMLPLCAFCPGPHCSLPIGIATFQNRDDYNALPYLPRTFVRHEIGSIPSFKLNQAIAWSSASEACFETSPASPNTSPRTQKPCAHPS